MIPTEELEELRTQACQDCRVELTVQVGAALHGPQLVVVVEHADTCPWSLAHVPIGGATLTGLGATLRHVRAGEPDMPEAS